MRRAISPRRCPPCRRRRQRRRRPRPRRRRPPLLLLELASAQICAGAASPWWRRRGSARGRAGRGQPAPPLSQPATLSLRARGPAWRRRLTAEAGGGSLAVAPGRKGLPRPASPSFFACSRRRAMARPTGFGPSAAVRPARWRRPLFPWAKGPAFLSEATGRSAARSSFYVGGWGTACGRVRTGRRGFA